MAVSLWSVCLALAGGLVGIIYEGGKLGEHEKLQAHREASVILKTIADAESQQTKSIDEIKSQLARLTVEISRLRDDVDDLKQR